MLRRDQNVRAGVQKLMDSALVVLSLWLAHLLRANPRVQEVFRVPDIAGFESYGWVCVILAVLVPLVLDLQGFYHPPVVTRRRDTMWALFKGCVIFSILVVLVLYYFRHALARSVGPMFGVISFILIALKEELRRHEFLSRFAHADQRRRFLLVGAGAESGQVRQQLASNRKAGIDVVGEVDLNTSPVSTLVELLHEHSINGVIINAKHTYFDVVEAAIRACEIEGVEVLLMADFLRTNLSRRSFDEFFGRPVMVFRTAPDDSWQSMAKRAMDFTLSLFLTVFFLFWLFPIIALLIKLTSPGPILFRQKRAGLNGRPFTMLKFRTMVTDAEQRKHELEILNEMSGPVFKVTNDPRVTPVGRFLRKFSIDEFPQLFNVLRGEMSMVGPRPLPTDEVKRFDDLAHRRRLSVKPGLTCLWQISGRNNIRDFKEWVRLDLEYIDNWSLWLDAKILARTVPVVLAGSGAK